MTKSVAIFGVSSRTGVSVVNAAIQKGLHVRVLLDCHAERPKGWGTSLEVVGGDVMDIQQVKDTLEGQEAAIVLLGTNDNHDVTCEGLKNIVTVMEMLYVKSISICFPTNTGSESREVLTKNRIQIYKILESSSLHWVAVVASHVTEGPATGYTIVRGHTSARHCAVSRQDLGAFLVDCLDMPERYEKTVEIASFAKT